MRLFMHPNVVVLNRKKVPLNNATFKSKLHMWNLKKNHVRKVVKYSNSLLLYFSLFVRYYITIFTSNTNQGLL